jgi:ATP phosphoribosyltransferase
LQAAGLGVVSTIMDTQTVLISNPHARHPDLVTKINKRFEGYLTATKHCFLTYNVERAHLPAALKITPGKRSPSISPLDDGEWVAINVMVPIGTVADVMDELEQVGATDILMFNIQNFRQGHGHGKVPSTERRPSAASPSPQ